MTPNRRLCAALVWLIGCQSVGSTLAQTLPFPRAPTTAADAAAEFDTRARAVIDVNACGREDDYLRIRTEMAAGNFDSEGEDLSHILTAKIAYIRGRTPTTSAVSCSGLMFRPRARNEDGVTFVHPTYEEFEKADRLLRAAGPTACAEETSRFRQDDPQGTVVLVHVSPACMARQVNEAILAMRKTTQLGSSGIPCVSSLSTASEGEFDATVRELVRILYLGGPNNGRREGGILAPSTIDHMYNELLAARGAVGDDSYSVVTNCSEPAGDELGSPEDTADRHAWYREVADFLGDFFEWLAKTYIEYSLLSGVGGLAVMPLLLLTDAADSLPGDIRIPESENHRLNIETSRYLTNADIIARLEAENYDRVDDVREDQAGVRTWLLQRLQDIAAHDFREYNARPYTRYSLNAILNLHDFSIAHGDPVMETAARIVLDLSGAKFAATSNRGRRIVPFRRRSEDDGDSSRYLFESINAADHEVARAMLLSGQTQLLDQNLDRRIMVGTIAEMVNGATSRYRLPLAALATAVERRPFRQTIRHAGVEQVLQSPAFTISAGGVRTDPTASLSVLELSSNTDRGVAMPTVIIPTIAGAYVGDLFRFEGIGTHHERSNNTCVADGFACGIQPKLSAVFDRCTKRAVTSQETRFFVSSAACFPESPGPHFYLAGRIADCSGSFCNADVQWGLMDIVEATPPPPKNTAQGLQAADDPAFNRFQVERGVALAAATPDASGNGTYQTAAGHRIDFSLVLLPLRADVASIRAVDGVPQPEWSTAGDAIDADGQGHATLKGSGAPVIIDFSDWSNPTRTP